MLGASIAKVFEKRCTSLRELEHIVDEIGDEVETGGREVPSSVIGAKVLEKLRAIDEVAYLRYASVYQRFQDVDQFVDAIHTLGRRIKPNALQRELFPAATAQGSTQASRTTLPTKNHARVDGRIALDRTK